MRHVVTLYNPLRMFQQPRAPSPVVIPSPAEDTAAADDSAEEAARKARADAAARRGRQASLLTDQPLGGLGATGQRRTLLGV